MNPSYLPAVSEAPDKANNGLCAANEAIKTTPKYEINSQTSTPLGFVFSLIKNTKMAIEKMVKMGALIVIKILGKPLNGSIAIGNNVNSNHKSRFM